MKILLFPTRFYPAISGGDFYVQRIGEEIKKTSLKKKRNQKNVADIITSNALDFGALRQKGKSIQKSHKNYVKYRNLSIKRLEVVDNQKSEKNRNISFFTKELKETLDLTSSEMNYFRKKGPILNDFPKKIKHLWENNKFPYELIHCSYLPYANLLYSLYIGKKYKIPTVVTPFLHEENKRYDTEIIYNILEKFDGILACTNYEKSLYSQHGIERRKIHVIPMGVDRKKFEKPFSKKAKKIYKIQKPFVLFCGLKNFEKGALSLLNTIPLLDKELKKLNIMFIGPPTKAFNITLGKVRKNLENTRIINITPDNLTGIYDKKKIGCFQLADVYCMPSRSEAYGIAYLEAWATKTPIIASNIPAMKEIISEGKNGILVNFDHLKEIKQAVLYLLKNPKKKHKMGKNGYKKVKKKNSWKRITKETLKIYKELINKNENT